MDEITILNSIIRNTCINFLIYYVFIKILDYKDNNFRKTSIVIAVSVIEAIMGRAISKHITLLPTILIVYILHGLIISKVTNFKKQYSIIITFIALIISYSAYTIAIIISSILVKMIIKNATPDNIIILLVAIIIAILILYRFFKIKRFKNGIYFLKDEEKINDIGIWGIAFIGVAILIYSIIGTYNNHVINTYLFTGIVIEAICLTIWIRRKITKHYRQNLRKNEIQNLENEIKSKDEEINKILEENNAIATINHKYSSRIKALEKISSKILTKPEIIEAMKAEFGEEFGELQEQISKISEEYTSEINEKVKHENKLEKTGIFGIDNILEYMQEQAENKGIRFEAKISGSINYLIEKIIDQSRLETLLGDHIKDAIIAIEHSDNTYKRILTTIGIIDDCYEIRIYDTGIEFEIETLLKLGTEAITTHKETGGSGIGFMTTFETLNQTKASLIIEEKHPMNSTDYTKVVAVRFDDKNQYRIKSYRAEEIKKQRKDNRIIVE